MFCWHQESPKDRQSAVVRQPRSVRASPASVASPLFASSAVPLLAPRGPRRVTRRRTVWRFPAPHGASENVRNRTTNHERARAIPPHTRLATPTCCIARAGDSEGWGLVLSSTPTVTNNVHAGTGTFLNCVDFTGGGPLLPHVSTTSCRQPTRWGSMVSAMCSPREERSSVLERQSMKCACTCGGIARTRVTVGWPELLDPAVAGWGEPR